MLSHPLRTCYPTLLLPLLLLSLSGRATLGGVHVEEVFRKPGMTCMTTYEVGMQPKVIIMRTYEEQERQEVIEVRLLHPDDAEELHAFVKKNATHLVTFMPFIVQRYGQSIAHARRYLQEMHKRYRQYPDKTSIELGIFVRSSPKAAPVLQGAIGFHSYEVHSKGSWEISYWLGKEASGKGLALTSTKAACLWASYTGRGRRFNMVIDPTNTSSWSLALKLPGAKEESSRTYQVWNYHLEQARVRVFSVMAHDFLAILRQQGQATKKQQVGGSKDASAEPPHQATN